MMRSDPIADSSPTPTPGRRRARGVFPLAVLLSVLLHIGFILALPYWREAPPTPAQERATLKLSLWEAPEPLPEQETLDEQPEPPEPTPEEQHLPRDTAERIDLDGSDFEAEPSDQPLADDLASIAQLPEPVDRQDVAEPPSQSDEPVEAGELTFTSEEALAERVPGGLQPMDEMSMGAAAVSDPRSDAEAKRIEMVNKYLARMAEQVRERWRMPADAGARHRGVVRMRVDQYGYLTHASLHLPSGHPGLDDSVLAAINAVPRYEVPDSPEIVRRYYSNLRFEYSGAP